MPAPAGRRALKLALISSSSFHTPPERYGGIERVVHQLAEALTRAGDEVTVYAKPGSKGGAYHLVEKKDGVWYPPVRELKAYDALCVHQTGWPNLWHFRAEMLVLRELLRYARHKPTLYTFHQGMNYWVRPLRASGLWPRHFVATTPNFREGDYARAHGLSRVMFVPNPVEDGTFRDASQKTREICFLAAMTPRKAPDFAIRLAREAGRPIVLAGPKDKPDFFAQSVQPELDAYPQARYVGEVTAQEKDDLLSRCAALLHPTRGEEPFGLVVAEAIVRGTPCLSSDAGGPAHIIGQSGGGRVAGQPDDPKTWAAALEGMLAHPPDARAMREACLAQYGVDGVARAYRAAIEAAVRG